MSLTQKYRAGIIIKSYQKWNVRGKKVLDIGCGNGVVSQVLKRGLDLDLTGTDIIDYRRADIPFKLMKRPDSLDFGDSSFDLSMFNDVLHHSPDVEPLLIEGARVAKQILIFEDKESPLLRSVDPFLNHFYSPRIPRTLNFKTLQEWCLLFDKLGFIYSIADISLPFLYPFRHMAFILSKK